MEMNIDLEEDAVVLFCRAEASRFQLLMEGAMWKKLN